MRCGEKVCEVANVGLGVGGEKGREVSSSGTPYRQITASSDR